MAHFAKLDENNIVTEVIVVDNEILLDENEIEQESLGTSWCINFSELRDGVAHQNWKQTSYNANFRKNYAGIGFTYDSERDAFIPPKHYESWILNEETCQYEAPVPYPQDENVYRWDEETTSWVLI